MKIALGCAQFGMKYAVGNLKERVPYSELINILKIARLSNIEVLDTAIVYGDSEANLGNANVEGFKVVTKIPSICGRYCEIEKRVEEALKRLKINSLYGLLFHDSKDFFNFSESIQSIERLKHLGLIDKVGISIYSPDELTNFPFLDHLDIVQAPYNIFDRRIETSGLLNQLKNKNIEVHVRSVFLQGLLLLKPSDRPKYFDKWNTALTDWDTWVTKNGYSRLKSALSLPLSNPAIDKVIVGVDNVAQLRAILEIATVNTLIKVPEFLSVNDLKLINPANWSLK